MKYTDILEDPSVLARLTLHLKDNEIIVKDKVHNKSFNLEINVSNLTVKEVYADCWSKKIGNAFLERRADMCTLIDPGNGKKMKTGYKRV